MGRDPVEASGARGGRIHLRQDKGDSLLTTPHGSGKQDSRGEAVCSKAVNRGCFKRGKVRRYGDIWNLPPFLKKFFFKRLFIFERHRVGAGQGQRERETQNLKQDAGSKLSAQSLMWGLNPQTVTS